MFSSRLLQVGILDLPRSDVSSTEHHHDIINMGHTYLSSLQHLPLIENLHGVNLLCVLHLHHGNLAEVGRGGGGGVERVRDINTLKETLTLRDGQA